MASPSPAIELAVAATAASTAIPMASRESLRGSTTRGSLWSLLGQAVRFVITMGSLVVMSRLLAPADYGLFSIVGAVTAFIGTFKDLGLSLVVVRERQLDQRQVSSVFWINCWAGLGLMSICMLLSPLLAAGFADRRLVGLLCLQALALPIGASAIVHRTLMRRRLAIAQVTAIDTLSLAVSTTVGIAMALKGSGVWSLPVMSLVNEVVGTSGIWWVSGWRPGRFGAWVEIRRLLHAGVHLQLVSLCNIATSSMEKLFVGRGCGTAALGLYARAQTLLTLPVYQIMQPLGTVIIPAFSVLHADPESYRRHFLSGFKVLALGSVVMTVVLVCCAQPLVALVLGHQWQASATIFACMAIDFFNFPLGQAIYWLFITQGRTADLARQSRWYTLTYLLAIAIGLPFGVIGVALSTSISGLLVRMPMQYYFVHHPQYVTWRDLAVITAPCALVAVVTATAAWLVIQATGMPGWSPISALLGSAAVSLLAVLVATAVLPWGRRTVAEGLQLVVWMRGARRN